MTDWDFVSWYQGMGSLEADIHHEIEMLRKRQDRIKNDKRNFYNWELSVNRIECIIARLYREQKVAKILGS